jgi:hypothetical protein
MVWEITMYEQLKHLRDLVRFLKFEDLYVLHFMCQMLDIKL